MARIAQQSAWGLVDRLVLYNVVRCGMVWYLDE